MCVNYGTVFGCCFYYRKSISDAKTQKLTLKHNLLNRLHVLYSRLEFTKTSSSLFLSIALVVLIMFNFCLKLILKFMKILSALNNTQKPTFVNTTYPYIPHVDIDKFVFNMISYFILKLLIFLLFYLGFLLQLGLEFITDFKWQEIKYSVRDCASHSLCQVYVNKEWLRGELILFSLWENSFI